MKLLVKICALFLSTIIIFEYAEATPIGEYNQFSRAVMYVVSEMYRNLLNRYVVEEKNPIYNGISRNVILEPFFFSLNFSFWRTYSSY